MKIARYPTCQAEDRKAKRWGKKKKARKKQEQQAVKSNAIQKEQTLKAENSEIPWASLEILMIPQGQFLHITVFPKDLTRYQNFN